MTTTSRIVIEAPTGDKWIVTEVRETNISAVSFNSENVSATQKLDDFIDRRWCQTCEGTDEDCQFCRNGWLDVPVKGWKHSKVLARSVEEFILNGIKKTWGL